MQKIKTSFSNFDRTICLIALGFGVVTPLLVKYVPLVKVKLIGVPVIFMLVNLIVAAYLGYRISRTQTTRWQLWIFPVIFLVMAHFFAAKYTLYFAAIYLCVSYLVDSMNRTSKA